MSPTQSTAKPHISTPLRVGDLTLRNRNVMASLTRNRAIPTNVPNKFNVEYYTQRAKGGAGLIVSEGTLVSQQGTEWPHAPGLWSDEHVTGWKAVTDSVHAAGSLMFCQVMCLLTASFILELTHSAVVACRPRRPPRHG